MKLRRWASRKVQAQRAFSCTNETLFSYSALTHLRAPKSEDVIDDATTEVADLAALRAALGEGAFARLTPAAPPPLPPPRRRGARDTDAAT
jgi:hypothetical protein